MGGVFFFSPPRRLDWLCTGLNARGAVHVLLLQAIFSFFLSSGNRFLLLLIEKWKVSQGKVDFTTIS